MRYLFLVIILLFYSYSNSLAQNYLFTLDSVSNFEKESVLKEIEEQKSIQYNNGTGYKPEINYQHIVNYKCVSLKEFMKKVIVIQPLIEKISMVDSLLIICYSNDFYDFNDPSVTFYYYHDIYNSFFSYDEVAEISLKTKNQQNITFLPTRNMDYLVPLEQSIMKKQWYLFNMDYCNLMGLTLMDNQKAYNKHGELYGDVLQRVINAYWMKKHP